MSTFLTGDDAYAPIRLRENEFEELIPRFVQRLSNRWHWAEWKPLLDSPYGRARPDAAMVSRELSSWCVVEVELASHPESHFRDQFAALEAAYYGNHLTASLASSFNQLPVEGIERLVSTEPPTMVCIADDVSEPLRLACRDFGFVLAVGKPFRSERGDYALDWGRLPPLLTHSTSTVEYLLRPSVELWSRRQRAYLPREFPNVRDFTMRCDRTIYPMKVVGIGDVRATLLPLGTVAAAGRPLLLRPVDPARDMYELVNGEVLG